MMRSRTPEAKAWSAMKQRCTNPNNKGYPNYGGRGITVCERWLNSLSNFLEDMGQKPTPEHTLDRIDVNGNYEPSNCRWATWHQQGANRRNNNKVVGVSYVPSRDRWLAILRADGKVIYRKYCKTYEEAVAARQLVDRLLHL